MLDDHALEQYFRDHSVPQAAQDYIKKTRRSQPEPGTGYGSHWSRSSAPFSTKMGRTIQAHSATAECAYVLISEYSDQCIEYWDQPPSFYVTWTFANGRKQTRPHIPDFLVLLNDGPAIVQCKTTSEINSLVITRNVDWARIEGNAVCIAAQTACALYGLRHLVFESADATTFYTANLALLLRARDSPDLVTQPILHAVKQAFRDSACATLDTLARAAQLTDYTPLIQLIERKVLYARLQTDLLTEPQAAWISNCSAALTLLDHQGAAESLGGVSPSATALNIPNAKCLTRGLTNLDRLKTTKCPPRSLRNLKAKVRLAQAQGMPDLLAVAPNWPACGNRDKRLPDEVQEFFTAHMENYLKRIPTCVAVAYREYRVLAEAHHPLHPPMGGSAFRRRLLARKSEIAKAEGGIRSEMAAAPSSAIEVRAARPQRAFEQAHIDHHLTDIFVCIARSGERDFVARLWLSVMVDSATGMILEFWLSLRAPSRRACAMLLRRCARRHGRLPENIITDHGAEFRSVYYSALLAYLKVNKHDRPVGNARYGSEAERFFLLYINTYVASRPGRIKHIRERRQISTSHSAERTASLVPADVFDDFNSFMDWNNNLNTAPNESAPPAELCASLLARFSCSGIPKQVDDNFVIASAVEAKDYSVDPARGIHTPVGWFVNGELMVLAGRRKRQIPVREEPEDPYRIYAYLDGRWITCRHSKDVAFLGKADHKRYGEALGILDGAEQHRLAKDHANMEFTKRMLRADEAREAQMNLPLVTQPAKLTSPDPTSASDVFLRARKGAIQSLSLGKWEIQDELA